MSEFLIREAGTGDLEILLKFEQELIKTERPYDECIREDPLNYYDLREMIESKEINVVVAEHKGRIVSSGYARVRRARAYLDHKDYAYVGFMYTLPEYRGMGVNKLIIRKLTSWAQQQGLIEVRLTVYDANLPAIKAYEKAGFKKHIIEMRMRLPG